MVWDIVVDTHVQDMRGTHTAAGIQMVVDNQDAVDSQAVVDIRDIHIPVVGAVHMPFSSLQVRERAKGPFYCWG